MLVGTQSKLLISHCWVFRAAAKPGQSGHSPVYLTYLPWQAQKIMIGEEKRPYKYFQNYNPPPLPHIANMEIKILKS